MDVLVICIVAFFTSILTFFSGFGLGTILAPVFMLFFPVDLSIALTGLVHFINNLFKLSLVGKKANREVLFRFGFPAIIASFFGAWIMLKISTFNILFTYQLMNKHIEVHSINFIIGILLIFFALMDLLPSLQKIEFDKSKLPFGGLLSGFFGGLSGHQGALRSAFLIKAGLNKEQFIGTAVVISCFVDFTRLSVYASGFDKNGLLDNGTTVIYASLSAIAGAYLGNKFLKKITLKFVQSFVAIALIIIAILLGSGIL